MHLRVTSPATRANDDLEFSARQWQIFLDHRARFAGIDHRDPGITPVSQHECTAFHAPYLAQGLVYVITETLMQYPYPYITEKTWKAMLVPVSFMLLAAPNSLAWLRDQGFQTFGQWWDESYDCLPRAADRVQAVVDQLCVLSKLDRDELDAMHHAMQPTLQHNLATMAGLRQRELAKIQRML